MNRTEALRILGLDDDATPEDVKTAYKETVQILHPDRFASNKKLQDRATEQFKNLQEAYDYLTSGKGSRTSARDPRAAAERARSYTSSNQVEARMAGVAAARTQLVKQRDVALDERRNGIAMTAIGGIVALIAGRRPFGLFGIVAAIASAAAVWGIVQVVSSQRTIATLNEHIAELNKEERRLAEELDDVEPPYFAGGRLSLSSRSPGSACLVARNVRNSSGKRTFRATIVLCGSGTRRRPHRKDHRRADLGMA